VCLKSPLSLVSVKLGVDESNENCTTGCTMESDP
jgi:hypothetical protein